MTKGFQLPVPDGQRMFGQKGDVIHVSGPDDVFDLGQRILSLSKSVRQPEQSKQQRPVINALPPTTTIRKTRHRKKTRHSKNKWNRVQTIDAFWLVLIIVLLLMIYHYHYL